MLYSVRVEPLRPDVKEAELRQLLGDFGDIHRVSIVKASKNARYNRISKKKDIFDVAVVRVAEDADEPGLPARLGAADSGGTGLPSVYTRRADDLLKTYDLDMAKLFIDDRNLHYDLTDSFINDEPLSEPSSADADDEISFLSEHRSTARFAVLEEPDSDIFEDGVPSSHVFGDCYEGTLVQTKFVIDSDSEPDIPTDVKKMDAADKSTFCLCKRASFGNMICCDNSRCPVQWFHFGCVNLKGEPKSKKWFCPTCRGIKSSVPKENVNHLEEHDLDGPFQANAADERNTSSLIGI